MDVWLLTYRPLIPAHISLRWSNLTGLYSLPSLARYEGDGNKYFFYASGAPASVAVGIEAGVSFVKQLAPRAAYGIFKSRAYSMRYKGPGYCHVNL